MLCGIFDHGIAGNLCIWCGHCMRLAAKDGLQLHLLPICRLLALQRMHLWLLPCWG